MKTQAPAGSARRSRIYGNNVLSQLLIVLGAISLSVAPNTADCPSSCQCRFVNSKYSALCMSAGYTFIPNIPNNVQSIYLDGNYINRLHDNSFISNTSMNLQRIYLKNVSLKQINRYTFTYLKILVELDLSDNYLHEIPLGTFSENTKLRILHLNGNPLKVLIDEQFPYLPHLRFLYLQNCQLEKIHSNAFLFLQNLTELNLESNNLKTIETLVFIPLEQLNTLKIDKNPWNCNCELKDFRNWYLSKKLDSSSVECDEPEIHKNVYWENLLSMDFSCYPHSEIIEDYTTYKNPNDNVTLHCKISGDPDSKIAWIYKDNEIDPNTSLIYGKYHIEKNKIDPSNSWSNLTIIDLIEEDTGEYICQASNILDTVSSNVSIVLSNVYRAKTVIRSNNFWFLVTGLIVVGLMVFILITSTVACGCMSYNRKLRRKHRRQIRSNKNIFDQEKSLLNNTEQFSRKSSCERLDTRGSIELLKHPSTISIDRYNTRRPYKGTTAVIPLSAAFMNPTGIYPPPPEFSNNIPQSNTLGNIYISVSLTDDPNSERYPDLLNHRGSTRNLSKEKASTSESVVPFATLPRRQMRLDQSRLTIPKTPKYDNMGKRITINGSSTLSLQPDRDRIPTPPPPPLSVNPDYDNVPL